MSQSAPLQRFELRGRVPTRLWALLALLDVLGLVLVVAHALWWPSPIVLGIGLGLVALGVVVVLVAVAVVGRLNQTITLDDDGLHVPPPRTADIAWHEVTAVKTDGRVLRVELRDRTQLVINGSLYQQGFAELCAALLERLRSSRR